MLTSEVASAIFYHLDHISHAKITCRKLSKRQENPVRFDTWSPVLDWSILQSLPLSFWCRSFSEVKIIFSCKNISRTEFQLTALLITMAFGIPAYFPALFSKCSVLKKLWANNKRLTKTYMASFADRPSPIFPLIISNSSPVPFSYRSLLCGPNFIFISCKKSGSQSSIFSGREHAGFLPGFCQFSSIKVLSWNCFLNDGPLDGRVLP